MNIISLTTDRRSDDFFLGRVKGEIARICPSARVIDLAHNLPAFDTAYASFIIKHSYKNFPDNTLHLIGVDSEEGPGQSHLVVKAHDQYFICADNGIISLIFSGEELPEIYSPLNTNNETKLPAMIRFAHLAQKIISEQPFDSFMKPVDDYVKRLNSSAVEDSNLLTGKIIYVDSYHNAITNIEKRQFEQAQNNRSFTVFAGNMRNKIFRISNTHVETQHGQLLAHFNSLGLLEISINKGRVMTLLNLSLYDEVRVEFSD